MIRAGRVAIWVLATLLATHAARAAESPTQPAVPITLEQKQVGLSDLLTFNLGSSAPTDIAKLRVRLDTRLFPDLLPQSRTSGQVTFDLAKMREDKKGWTLLVGQPPLNGSRTVSVVLTHLDGSDLSSGTDKMTVTLVVFRIWRVMLAALVVGVLIWAVVKLARNTDALRDTTGPDPILPARRQYSLGRCQMAFWFVLVTACFIMVWLVVGTFNDVVSTQSVNLLGISGATALAAVAIDVIKLQGAPAVAASTHDTFWRDVLRDSSGWSFNRLQVLVWTLLLSAISLWSAYDTLALPEFDSNLLLLMGVSSSVYVGFKIPTKPA